MALREIGFSAGNKSAGWQEAIAELVAERTRATDCAARARTLDAETAATLATLYASAKAEVDAVISALTIALVQGGKPTDLASLQERMERGAKLRLEFCQAVLAHAPLKAGQKGEISDALRTLVDPLRAVVAALWERHKEMDALRRDTIRAQLEAARWPEFSAIPPAA